MPYNGYRLEQGITLGEIEKYLRAGCNAAGALPQDFAEQKAYEESGHHGAEES
jgi:hypothetical protein